jgi:hypothetical protein
MALSRSNFLTHLSCAAGFEEFDVKPTIFPDNELRAATRDFYEDMKLGQGGYGAVYKVRTKNMTTIQS